MPSDKLLGFAVALALVTVTAPVASAAGGSASRGDAVQAVFTTPSLSSADLHQLNLSQGEHMDVEIGWQDSNADLDLLITPPGSTCQLAPNPEVTCLAETTEDRVRSASCSEGSGEGQSIGFGPASESADVDAGVEGTYEVWVLSSTGVPFTPIPYSITVTTTDDGFQDLNQPRPFTLLRSDGHCRGL